jgi:hypothetical protein
MDYELTDDYIAEARQRAYRFQGQWCGTSGSLAADVARLLHDRKRMQGTITSLEDTNAQLRAAVEARTAATDAAGGEYADAMRNTMGCCNGGKLPTTTTDDAPAVWRDISTASAEKYAADRAEPEIPVDWILQGQREMDAAPDDIRWTGDSIMASPPDDIRPGSREFLDVLDELKTLHLKKTLDYGIDEDALSNIRNSADVVNMPAWAGCVLRISDKMHRLKAYFRRGKCEFDGVEDTLQDIACYAAIALVLYRERKTDPV